TRIGLEKASLAGTLRSLPGGGAVSTGQLRVYFGAAPGVGKTYKMLEEGHRRLERGTDVVVGFVETHGRQHTAELIEGFEVGPRASVTYRGATRPAGARAAPMSWSASWNPTDASTLPNSSKASRWSRGHP